MSRALDIFEASKIRDYHAFESDTQKEYYEFDLRMSGETYKEFCELIKTKPITELMIVSRLIDNGIDTFYQNAPHVIIVYKGEKRNVLAVSQMITAENNSEFIDNFVRHLNRFKDKEIKVGIYKVTQENNKYKIQYSLSRNDF